MERDLAYPTVDTHMAGAWRRMLGSWLFRPERSRTIDREAANHAPEVAFPFRSLSLLPSVAVMIPEIFEPTDRTLGEARGGRLRRTSQQVGPDEDRGMGYGKRGG